MSPELSLKQWREKVKTKIVDVIQRTDCGRRVGSLAVTGNWGEGAGTGKRETSLPKPCPVATRRVASWLSALLRIR